MRHGNSGRKLGRVSSHRKALLRTLATQFFENEKLVTTVSKAKELRPYAEKMITMAKGETLHARRQALSKLRKKSVVEKLFADLAPRFADRNGGYCRIIRLGVRKGDAAERALIELLGSEFKAETKPAKGEKKKAEPKEKKETKAKAKAEGEKKAKRAPKAEKTGEEKGKKSRKAAETQG